MDMVHADVAVVRTYLGGGAAGDGGIYVIGLICSVGEKVRKDVSRRFYTGGIWTGRCL